MRIIIKPGGLIALVVAIASLVALVFVSRKGAEEKPGAGTASRITYPAATANRTGNLLRDTGWQNYMEESARSRMSPLSGPGVPAQPAQHFVIEQIGKKSWNLGYINKLTDVTLSSGDKLKVRFWAKSTGANPIIVLLQRDAPPFPHAWKQHINLTTEWKEYTYTFSPTERYGPGESVFAIQFGEATGTIDLAGITLERL